MNSLPRTSVSTSSPSSDGNRYKMRTGVQYIRLRGQELPVSSLAGTTEGQFFYPAGSPLGFFVFTKKPSVRETYRDVKRDPDKVVHQENPVVDLEAWK